MITDELKQKVKEQIGHVYGRDLFGEMDIARENAPPGWHITYTSWHITEPPPNSVLVGRVRVRTHDPDFLIYATSGWLGVPGAVEFYGIKKSTLTKALRNGEIIDAKKQNGKWRFKLAALLEWDATMQKRRRISGD